jgi:hypothetical protein
MKMHLALLPALLGCSSTWSWEVPPIVTVSSASLGTHSENVEAPQLALRDVAQATCDHESSCLKVGPNNAWPTYEACLQTTHARLAYLSCTGSVRQTRLSSCIDDIRADPCVSARASSLQVSSCTSEQLCSPE